MSYHVFYNSNKEIAWSTNADVSDQIKTEQADAGFSYVHTDLVGLPTPDSHYVNDAGDTVLAKTAFTPSNNEPFAAQSRDEPVPYSFPAKIISGVSFF